MIRMASTAYCFTCSSFVKSETIGTGNIKKKKVTIAINVALYCAVFITERSALSGCLAPRFCPTSVVAALLNPHAGKIKNITILNAV